MGGILSVAGIEGFLENRGELKEVAADEDGPIKIFVQLSPFLSPGLKELESLTDRAAT